jgi:large repetitive protein
MKNPATILARGSLLILLLITVQLRLVAADPITQRWFKPLGTYVDSAPSQGADGTIFVGTAYSLLAFDPSGNQKWSFGYNNGSMKGGSAVPLADGGVVFVTLGGQVSRLSSEGDVVWQNVYGSGTSQPIALGADGTIYHADRDWKIYATNPDGTHKWSFDTGGAIYGGPVIGRDGTIYCGSDDGKLYALKPNGSLRWELNLGTMIKMPPVIGDDGTIYVVGENGKLYAISPNGAKKWEYAGYAWPSHTFQPIIGLDGAIYYPVSDRFVAINPNGTLRWEAHLATGIVVGAVALADGSFYVIDSRRIYHLESDGTERRQYLHDFYGPPPLVTADGTIYMGHYDNAFAALTGGIAPADTAWPMLQRDSLRTGRRPQLPAVDLLLPVDSGAFVSGHNVPLRARVLNLPAVDRVDFYRGATLLSSDGTEPFEASWTSSGTAPQTFSAIAYLGALSVTSEVSTINLLSSRPNTLPSAQIVTPTNNTSVVAGSALRIAAQASDPDGAVLNVEVFDGNTSVGSAAFPDFNVSINALAPGEHLLRAVATDNFGDQGTSAVVRVYAVQKKWEYVAPHPGFRSPALDADGNILVGASEWIYAVNGAGEETWVRHLGSVAISTPFTVAADGTLYFGTSDARLFARHPDGTAKWDFPLDGQVIRPPAIGADGTLYMGGSGGKLYAIRPNGTKQWDYTPAGNVSGGVVIGGDGGIYLATGNGYLTALNPEGQFRWEFYVDGAVNSAPAIGADGMLYFGSAHSGKFFAVSPEGVQRWMLPLSSGVANASPSIGLDGTIYCGSNDGTLLAIRPNGTLKWSLPLGGEIQGTPAVAANGSIYIGTGSGRNFLNISASGVKVWELVAPSFSSAASPLILDNGDVVVSSGDRLLILGGDSGPAGGPWPMFMQNRQHTGRAWEGPVPTLTSPQPETIYTLGEAVPLSVDVSSSLSPVVKVEYLANSNVVATVNTPPFSTTWNPPGGVHHVQARATDNVGAVRSSTAARIKVVPPGTSPTLLVSPVSITTVTNGASVTLRVDAFGSGPLDYAWFKDGVPIDGATGPELTLDATTLADAAKYHVRVANAHGQIQSGPAAVNILQPVIARWISSSGTQTHVTPALGEGGVIHYMNDSGEVTVYDPRGNFEWGFVADLVPVGDALRNDRVRSSPAIHTDGVVHFGTEAGRFYQLNPDGTRLRRFDTPGHAQSSPALGTNGNVYFGTSGGLLRAYSATGGFLWQLPVVGSAKGAPAIGSDGRLYFTSEGDHVGNNLYSGRLNAATPGGQLVWSFITGDRVVASPAIGADGTLYFGSRDHKFYAVTPAGTRAWDFPTDGPINGSAVVGPDGTIYFGNSGVFDAQVGIHRGNLYALRPDGQLKWSFQVGGEIRSTPAVAADGTIYFGADDWYVYALNPNGTLRWKHPTPGMVQSGLTIGFDGTVYATSLDGQLHALHENISPLANSPWPKFKHDARGTGNVATPHDNPDWVFPFGSNAFNGEVTTITVEGANIYVGGVFTIAGGRAANRVARWDGTNWSALGAGADGLVSALAWFNGELYMGGDFLRAGDQDIRYLARWNGTAWLPVDDGVNGRVRDLVVHEGSLFVGGEFGIAGGIDDNIDGMARWDGASWQATGTNSPIDPGALAVINGVVHAGVPNLGPPEDRSYGILRWLGAGWEEVARGLNDRINTLAYFNGHLHVGGRFSHAGGQQVNGIARWTGSAWQGLGTGMGHWLTPDVRALTVHNGALHAAGFFQRSGGTPANNLARWNGSSWSALGTGLTRGNPGSMPVGSALANQDNSLLVGGVFLAANDDRGVRYFARWQDNEFQSLGSPLSYEAGVFRLTLFPDFGSSYGIEASSNLVHWERLVTFTNQVQAAEFIDTDAAQNPRRFYRAVSP